MSRSVKKGPFVAHHLLKKLNRIDGKTNVTTWSRASTVIPLIIGNYFRVYNGRRHLPVFVTDQMVGHKLGEFSHTRSFHGHIKSGKKIKRLRVKDSNCKTYLGLKILYVTNIIKNILSVLNQLNLIIQE